MAIVTTASKIRYIGGRADSGGVQIGYAGGATGGKIGFYGKAPIVQPLLTPVSTATATTTLNETRIVRIYSALVALGLVRTA